VTHVRSGDSSKKRRWRAVPPPAHALLVRLARQQEQRAEPARLRQALHVDAAARRVIRPIRYSPIAPIKYLLWLVSTGIVANRFCASPDLDARRVRRGSPPPPFVKGVAHAACAGGFRVPRLAYHAPMLRLRQDIERILRVYIPQGRSQLATAPSTTMKK